jgi:hypothetical protein
MHAIAAEAGIVNSESLRGLHLFCVLHNHEITPVLISSITDH